jgi:ferredoxin-NADP reductase
VVPLVAMLRHATAVGKRERLRLAVSARTLAELPYADELRAAGALIALSREDDATGRAAGRLAAAEIRPLVDPEAVCYICGSASFAGGASDLITGLGVTAGRIRIEQFGPS